MRAPEASASMKRGGRLRSSCSDCNTGSSGTCVAGDDGRCNCAAANLVDCNDVGVEQHSSHGRSDGVAGRGASYVGAQDQGRRHERPHGELAAVLLRRFKTMIGSHDTLAR